MVGAYNWRVMRRRAFHLVLRHCGVAALLVWAASFLVAGRCGNGRTWEFGIVQGLVSFERGRHATHVCLHCTIYHEYSDGLEFRLNTTGEFELRLAPSYLGFADGFLLVVPFWPAVVGFMIMSIVIRQRARFRQRPGYCDNCGYDLTGNVSGQCSECGKKI